MPFISYHEAYFCFTFSSRIPATPCSPDPISIIDYVNLCVLFYEWQDDQVYLGHIIMVDGLYNHKTVNVDSSPYHIKVNCFWSYLLLETEKKTKPNQAKPKQGTPNLADNGLKCQVPEALLSSDNQDTSNITASCVLATT